MSLHNLADRCSTRASRDSRDEFGAQNWAPPLLTRKRTYLGRRLGPAIDAARPSNHRSHDSSGSSGNFRATCNLRFPFHLWNARQICSSFAAKMLVNRSVKRPPIGRRRFEFGILLKLATSVLSRAPQTNWWPVSSNKSPKAARRMIDGKRRPVGAVSSEGRGSLGSAKWVHEQSRKPPRPDCN